MKVLSGLDERTGRGLIAGFQTNRPNSKSMKTGSNIPDETCVQPPARRREVKATREAPLGAMPARICQEMRIP